MKRKTPLLILLALGLAFACRWNHSRTSAPAADSTDRRQENSAAENSKNLSAPEAPPADRARLASLARQDPDALRKLVAQATQTASQLSECLRQDLCGQGPIGGYFDKHNTPINRLLNRSLRFLKTARDSAGSAGAGYPSRGELLKNFRIPNTETQILSLELLLEPESPDSKDPAGHLSDPLTRQLFDVAPAVKDDAKPLYFETMDAATEDSPEEHEEFVDALSSSFRNDDINTVADTVAGLNALQLNEDEFRQAVSNLCYIKSDPDLQHNWNEIDSHLIAYHETHAFTHSDPDQICGNSG